MNVRALAVSALSMISHWHLSASLPLTFISVFILPSNNTLISASTSEQELIITHYWKSGSTSLHNKSADSSSFPPFPLLLPTPAWFTMTTESGADSEAKQPQENKENEKGKAAEPTSPQNQPEQLPAAAGHSTPARKEQVSPVMTTLTGGGSSHWLLEFS